MAVLRTILIVWLMTHAPISGAEKKLPISGEVFAVDGRTAFLILPDNKPAKLDQGAMPWVWYAPTLRGLPGGAEKWMFERFLKAGIAIAGVDVGESYGTRKAGRRMRRCINISWRNTAWPSGLVYWRAVAAG